MRRLYVVAPWMVYVRFRAQLLFPHLLLLAQLLMPPRPLPLAQVPLLPRLLLLV